MTLFLYCAGGVGREMMEFAMYVNSCYRRWDAFGFIDDVIKEKEVNGIPVYRYEDVKIRFNRREVECVIASGEPYGRQALYEKLVTDEFTLTNLIHPGAPVSPAATWGKGIIVTGMASINAGVKICDNVLLDTVVLGHDVEIGPHSVLTTNAFVGGHTVVGSKVFIGPGCLIRDRLKIGDGSILTMGSVVMRNVKEEKIMMGNPAKVIGVNETHQVFGKG